MRTILSLTLLAALAVPACGSPPAAPSGTIQVVTSFYPLGAAAAPGGGDPVGGARGGVTCLPPPGVEPHDLELTPSQLGAIADADLVVYLGGGFQPAV